MSTRHPLHLQNLTTPIKPITFVYMSTSFHPQHALKYPDEMLVQLALGMPKDIVEEYGYTYDTIKDLPHFLVQADRIAQELMAEGAITRVIAGAGLHQIVETVAHRILDPRMPTGDLLKAGEFLKKVKDDGVVKNGPVKPQFTIEISFPDGSTTTITQNKAQERLVEEVPYLEVDDDPLPDGILESYAEDKFGVDID